MDLFDPTTATSATGYLELVRPTEIDSFPTSSLKHHITRLVVTRAAAVRATNPELAAEYRKLATLGSVDAAVYLRVLRSSSGPVTIDRADGPRAVESQAA